MRASLALLAVLLIGSCVGGREPTAPGGAAIVALALQPALIPSAADGSALPIHRIRVTVARQPEGVLLREQQFDVSPTAASWTLDVSVPLDGAETQVVVYLYLFNVGSDGTEALQFSGRTAPLTLSGGTRLTGVEADIVRGPLSNFGVTGVAIGSPLDTLFIGQSVVLSADVTSTAAYQLFWTSLDATVVGIVDATATGLTVGTASVVASAGAHADTATIVVIVPPVDSVRVSPDSADVTVGQTRTYTAQLFDSGGGVLTGRPVTWTTGNGSIATVTTSGVVTGVAPGTTTVRATSEGVLDEAIVRVVAAPIPSGANSWIAGSGAWSNPAKWTLGRIPNATDTVRIEDDGDYTVTLDVDATIARLVVNGTTDPVMLDVGDRELTVGGGGVGMEVDVGPLGELRIQNGAVVTFDVANAGLVEATGSASLEANSLLNTGTLRLSGGSLGIGHPAGSGVLLVGTLDLGTGVIRFLPNTTVTYDDGTILGTGIIVLESAELVLASNLELDGPDLILEDGSSVEDIDGEELTIGPLSYVELLSTDTFVDVEADLLVNGSLSASGPNSRVGSLVVGATGNVFVDDEGAGGLLETAGVENFGNIWLYGPVTTFGAGPAAQIVNRSTGAIELNPGAESLVLDGELINEGTIDVASATRFRRTDGAGTHVTANHLNSGQIHLAIGGELTIELGGTSPTFTNGGTITLNEAGNVLSVVNLAAPQEGSIINTDTGVLQGLGTVDVRTGVPSGINQGTIEPGLSPGLLTWLGSIPMGPNGSIAIELQGTAPGTEHDQLNVSADLVLSGAGPATGTLEVTAPSFVPGDGDRFAVLTFRERLGNFATVNLPVVAGITFDTLWVEDLTNVVPDTLYIVASGQAAPAGLNSWVEGIGGNWSDGSRWSLGRPPIAGDTVRIEVGGGYTVVVDEDATIDQLLIQGAGSPTTLELGDNELFVNGTGPGVEVFVQTLGRITMNNGALRTVDVQNDGLIRPTGALAIFEFTTLDNGGTIELPSGAVLTVGNGVDSEYMQSGTLSFQGGGILSVTPNTSIMYYGGEIAGIGTLMFAPDATITLTTDLLIDGPAIQLNGGSILTASNELLTIGNGGTLTLQSAAAPVLVQAAVQLDGTLVALGADNRIGDLTVGPAGNVLLAGGTTGVTLVTGDVVNEGMIAALGFGASFGPGNGGEIINEIGATIALNGGADSYEINGVLENLGSIAIGSDTRLHNFDDLSQDVTAHHLNIGTITILAQAAFEVRLGGASPSFTNDGSIELADATSQLSVLDFATPAGSFVNGASGLLGGDGLVTLPPTIELTNQGTVAPGLSPGLLTISGTLAMALNSTLEIEIEGIDPQDGHDQLRVTEDLVLDVGGAPSGVLEITTPGAFIPSDGERFAVLTFQSRSGTFAQVDFPVIAGITMDTLWTQTEGIDTLYIVATGTGGPAPVNHWTNPLGGNWSDGANWSLGVAPLPTDTVRIDAAGTYTVTLDVNTSVAHLEVGSPAGVAATLDVGNQTLTVAGSGGGIVQVWDAGTLQIANGIVVAEDLFSDGAVTVSETASIHAAFETYGTLHVQAPVGLLTMGPLGTGGYLYNEGAITVDGGGILLVGNEANFDFAAGTISGGGIVHLGPGSEMTLETDLTLDGTHLALDGAELSEIGDRRLNIGVASTLQLLSAVQQVITWPSLEVHGGVLASGPDIIAADSIIVAEFGTLAVDASGGPTTVFETTPVENFGTITLQGSGDVSFGPGANPASLTNRAGGTLAILPGGPRTINGELINEGILNISGSTVLYRRTPAPSSSPVTAQHANAGTLTLNIGASLEIELADGAASFTNSGTIDLTDPNTVIAIVNLLSPPGSLIQTPSGVITGSGTIDTRSLATGIPPVGIIDGLVTPGPGAQILNWLGGMGLGPDGALGLEIFDLGAGTGHDQLNVGAILALDGTLDVSADVTPTDGDRYPILTTTQVVGNFHTMNLPTVAGFTLDTLWVDGISQDTLFVVATATGGPAPVNRWTNSLGGNWSDGANWSENRAPIATDSVVIDADGDYEVTLDVDATVRNLDIGGGVGTQFLSSTGRTLTLDGPSVIQPNAELFLNGTTMQGSGALVSEGSVLMYGGTLGVPYDNEGLLELSASAVNVTAAFANGPAGLLRVRGIEGITANVVVSSGFTNAGTIELDGDSDSGSTLTVTDGTLINDIDGLIHVLAGEDRNLNAELDNRGTLWLERALTIDAPDATHTNSGDIDVDSGPLTIVQTAGGSFTNLTGGVVSHTGGTPYGVGTFFYGLTIEGGTVDFSAGQASGGLGVTTVSNAALVFAPAAHNGPWNLSNVTTGPITIGPTDAFSLVGGTVSAPITNGGNLFVSNGTIDAAVTNNAILLARGTSALNGPVTTAPGSSISVFGTNVWGASVLTVADGFTNNGTLSLGSQAGSINSELVVTSGTLTNAANATLTAGAGGTNTLTAALDNQGTVTIFLSTTFSSTFNQLAGGSATVATGQTLTVAGLTTLQPSSTTTADAGASIVTNGGCTDLGGTIIGWTCSGGPAPVNRWLGGDGNWSLGTNWSQNSPPDAADSVVIDADGPYTLTLDVDATIRNLMLGGGASTQTLSGTGRNLTIDGASMVQPNGLLTLTNSAVTGTGSVASQGGITLDGGAGGGNWSIPLDNAGPLTVSGPFLIADAFSNAATGTLRVDGLTDGADLTFSNGFTNEGTIELTGTGFANVTVVNSVLVNETGGLIDIQPGGGRIMTAALDNRGTLQLGRPLTINALDATHTNSGTIDLTNATLTVAQTDGTGSFTNEAGGEILLGFNLNVNGGTLNLTGGTVSGPNPSLIRLSDATLDYVFESLPERMTMDSVTVTNGLTIPVGDTLTLWGGGAFPTTIPTSAVDVQGTLQVIGVVNLGGSLTTSGTLDVHGSSGIEAQLTVDDGWTNEGTIQLTGGGNPPNDVGSRLTVTNGTLTNDVTGVITSIAGGGDIRELTATVDNFGLFNVNQSMTHNGLISQRGGSLLSVPPSQILTLIGTIELYLGSLTIVDGELTGDYGCTTEDETNLQITGGGIYQPCFLP